VDEGDAIGAGRDDVTERHRRLLGELTGPGDWWDGAARREIMAEARAPGASDALPPAAVEVVRRVVSESGRLDRTWADAQIAVLGAERYAEVVGVTAIVTAVDVYARAVGDDALELPEATAGPPAAERPPGVGDVGAWIPMTLDKALANVSRALSLVPRTNATWRALVTESYSRGPEMLELTWSRALTRPQIELVAATVSRQQECFY
jgi:hypothetical protein